MSSYRCRSVDMECFGDSENVYLKKVFDKYRKSFKNSDQMDGKPKPFRSHIRFDLGNNSLPKFCLEDELWDEAVKQFLVINKSLKIVSEENLSIKREIISEKHQMSKTHFNTNFTKDSKIKCRIFDNFKLIRQLDKVIQTLKKDPHNRRLVVCSLDPRDPWSPGSSEVGHFVFQFVVNSRRLDACLYLTSCDLESDLPTFVLVFSLVVAATGRAVAMATGELVVFVEQTTMAKAAPRNGAPFPEVYAAMDSPGPKLRLFEGEEEEFGVVCHGEVLEGEGCKGATPTSESKLQEEEEENKDETTSVNAKHHSETNPDEGRYLDLVEQIIARGCPKPNRTGVDARGLFGARMVYDLRDGRIPVLTTKRIFWKGVVEELLWFIGGGTNAKELSKRGVRIWDANGSRRFLDHLGFVDREEGDLGPVYGFQWRHFGAKYRGTREDYSGEGVDQLKQVVECIKSRSKDGLTTVTSWNDDDVDKMVLPSCHVMFHFTVSDGDRGGKELNCSMYQRSADMGLGVPFNVASYALLTHAVAHVTGLGTGDFVHCLGDAHVYENHVEPLREQLRRSPRAFPKLRIERRVESVDGFEPGDFELSGYEAEGKIGLEMAL